MAKLDNDNILGLIYDNLKFSNLKQVYSILRNKTANKILLKYLTFENTFKSINSSKLLLQASERNDISSAALLPDGNLILSGFNKLTIWDMKTYECIKTIHDDFSLMILLPGNKIVSSSLHGFIKFWDVKEDYKCFKEMQIHFGIYKLFLLTCGKLIYCIQDYQEERENEIDYSPNSIYTLDYINGFEVKELKEYKSTVSALANLFEDKLAIAVWRIISICIINSDGLKLCVSLRGHSDNITDLLFVEKENMLISGANDNTIRIWNLNSYCCIKAINVGVSIGYFLMLPNKYFAFCNGGVINIFSLNSFQCINSVETVEGGIWGLFLLKDYRIIAITYKSEYLESNDYCYTCSTNLVVFENI
jgi:WD40 repeat protein